MPFNKPGFGRSTVLLLGLGFLALVATSAAALRVVRQTNAVAQAVGENSNLRRAAWTVQVLLQDAETGQRGYILTEDPAYLQPYSTAIAMLPAAMDRLSGLSRTDAFLHERFDQLSGLATSKLSELARTIELERGSQRGAALSIVRSGRGRTIMDEVRGVLGEIISHLDARQAAAVGLALTTSHKLLAITLIAQALVVIFAGTVIWTVLRYMRDLRRAGREISAAHAGLEQRVAERTQELEVANAQLERANEEVQRFAYIVSHDLRAPLVNIMGFTAELELGVKALQHLVETVQAQEPALLSSDARVAAEADLPEAIGFIRSSTERMDRLINAILRLSREGRRNLTPEPVAMNGLIEAIASSLQHQLDAAGAQLSIEGRLPDVVSDRLGLEQIFGNLVDNAVKYLLPSRAGVITVRGRADGLRVIYEVADNGRGIAEADRERVFELFRRAGNQDRPGEGIGLAHVRAMVRRLNGTITCESRIGEGSVFYVNLPKILGGTARERA